MADTTHVDELTERLPCPLPPSLWDEEDHAEPRQNAETGRDIVDPSPAQLNHDDRARHTDGDDEDTLSGAYKRERLVPLMDEQHVLQDKWNQSLHSAGPEPLEHPCGDMAVQTGTESCPEPASPSHHTGKEEHWASTIGDG